ncbi:glycosyltransferase family 2 protein [Methylocapsa palsarum]|uniref:Glycosyl transferase family 2 n=1 Tax=Methylocapsa palsarum TaxID=1612308 RepID=A0A1I3YUM2_9HYPH|nr:glycosyltransferase [Methylocapsa palsarum]SFK35564.1 Glycosyl transferase family 2 [Methylocapsa palsarum]
MNVDPLISCLLVTTGGRERFDYLQRSVTDFCRQTYQRKELVVVFDGAHHHDQSICKAYLAQLARDDITTIENERPSSLGQLRNISRGAAHGEICCQWDDDDFHHPQRLERQLKALIESGRQAVYLQEVMHYFIKRRDLYCMNWRATPAMGHPGTLMLKRSANVSYPESGEQSACGEDLAVAMQLHEKKEVCLLEGAPHLYVYISHGANTWPDDHHQMLANSLSISRGQLTRRETQIRDGLRAFDFGRDPVRVQGNNGPAFTIGGA